MGNENLQNALQQAGLTIEAFARVINVDPKSVGRWVSGNTIPYPRHRQAIARALDLDEHELWPDQTPAPGEKQNRRDLHVVSARDQPRGAESQTHGDPQAADPPAYDHDAR